VNGLRLVFGLICLLVGLFGSNVPGWAWPGLLLALIGLYFTFSALGASERRP
jgi:membrane-bound ClpP family serine protease